jgi:hypothetical protein
MLNIRLALNRYALMRQLNINADEFRMAMYYQLLFLSFIEEFGELKNSMTDKQFAKYLAATLCLDYK